jgi:uncharacterized damage-inducible protein DinB
MAASAALGWPAVAAGSWSHLRGRFLDGLQQAAALGEPAGSLERPVTPALELPMLAHYTVGDVLVHVANHNAHHLGQVVLLRQLMGRWPPAAGGWTW